MSTMSMTSFFHLCTNKKESDDTKTDSGEICDADVTFITNINIELDSL